MVYRLAGTRHSYKLMEVQAYDCLLYLQIPSGYMYNITVIATNFLQYSSEPLLHQFTKEASDADVSVQLEGDTEVNPDDFIRLRTVVTKTACSTVSVESISVSFVLWMIYL